MKSSRSLSSQDERSPAFVGLLRPFQQSLHVPVILLLLGCILLISTRAEAAAEVQSDTATCPGTWVFKDGDCGCPPCQWSCAYEDLYRLDMLWAYVFDPPLGNYLETPAGSQPLGDIPIDSLHVAPSEGYVRHIGADINEQLSVNRTYVLRTRDGGHALVRPLTLDLFPPVFLFAYKYQPDGSGVFDGTPVKITSWGEVKTLFER